MRCRCSNLHYGKSIFPPFAVKSQRRRIYFWLKNQLFRITSQLMNKCNNMGMCSYSTKVWNHQIVANYLVLLTSGLSIIIIAPRIQKYQISRVLQPIPFLFNCPMTPEIVSHNPKQLNSTVYGIKLLTLLWTESLLLLSFWLPFEPFEESASSKHDPNLHITSMPKGSEIEGRERGQRGRPWREEEVKEMSFRSLEGKASSLEWSGGGGRVVALPPWAAL